MENVFLTKSDIKAALIKELSGLQSVVTDIDIKMGIDKFVETESYQMKKSLEWNVKECLSNIAFRFSKIHKENSLRTNNLNYV